MTLADYGLHQAVKGNHRRRDGDDKTEMRNGPARRGKEKAQACEKARDPKNEPGATHAVSHQRIIA